tara:strand:+ start:5588 stop:6304 length:717 start_codon:yes stop_codon:yes gene_type:complete
MYNLSNYLLSVQSNWYVNQPLIKAIDETVPMIAKYKASSGTHTLEPTPVFKMCKRVFPDIYKVPLLRRQYCTMLCEEIELMKNSIAFVPNDDEDELRQIPEIVLKDHIPDLYRNMWFLVKTVINPILMSLYCRDNLDIASVQIANYSPKEKKKGAWHHDDSCDISVVIPLNTGKYEGGGTEFYNKGTLNPLPNGHALIFPSFNNLHRGLAVESGDRYLLVFWLVDKNRTLEIAKEVLA